MATVVNSLVWVGCATAEPLAISQKELTELLRASAAYMTISEPSSFEDRARKSPLGALFGAAGAIADVSTASGTGKAAATRMSIPDPSIRLGNRFQEALKSSHSVGQIVLQPTPDAASKPKGVLFTFTTTLQGIFCHANRCERARAGYEVRAKLYNNETSSAVWTSECKTFSPSIGYPKEKLLENDGALLKESLLNAADHCADVFLKELFSEAR